MNSLSTSFYGDRRYDGNSPGVLTVAILTAAFYSATALTNVVLRAVSLFASHSGTKLAALPPIPGDSEDRKQNVSEVSNVVDFQQYKSSRSR